MWGVGGRCEVGGGSGGERGWGRGVEGETGVLEMSERIKAMTAHKD